MRYSVVVILRDDVLYFISEQSTLDLMRYNKKYYTVSIQQGACIHYTKSNSQLLCNAVSVA